MKNFNETIKKYGLIDKNDKILVGFSGGPDSLALLLGLAGLSKKLGFAIHIAHIDHNLRKESKVDALFVKKWAEKLKIPASFKSLSPGIIRKKGSLEANFREARLKFFLETARKITANKVALGHNLDDQAETVLMRILRGTGLSGLSGISAKRSINGIIFIRPLLETTRKEIEWFLKKKSARPRIDLTNRDDIFLRNKIRNRLMPLLKKEYNRKISEVLASLAQSVSFDYEYLDQAAKSMAKGGLYRLNLKKAKKLPTAILRLKLRQCISHVQGDTRRIGFAHIKEIEDLLNNRPAGSIVDLPKGVAVQKTANNIRFFKR